MCTKYKVIVRAHAMQRKKVHQNLDMGFDEYFDRIKCEAEQKAVRISKDVKKTVESNLWLSNEFPLKI